MRFPFLGSWVRLVLALVIVAVLLGARVRPARADDAGTAPTFSAADFTLTLSRLDASNKPIVLDKDALATLLNAARCACPIDLVATVGITSTAAAMLGQHTLEATLGVGSDCDNAAAAVCKTVGSTLTLTAGKTEVPQPLSTSQLFAAAATGASCGALPTSTTRLVAVLRLDGVRQTVAPALALNVGGAPPAPPAGVTAEGADGNALVGWKAPADTTKLSGFQVLCAPGVAAPSTAAYSVSCADAALGTPAIDPASVCSGLVAAGATSVRVKGLQNGQAYQLSVIAIGSDGTPSAVSAAVMATPQPTVGFQELYQQEGGTAAVGCAVAGSGKGGGEAATAFLVVVAVAMGAGAVIRRRRSRGDGEGRRRGRGPRRGRVVGVGGIVLVGVVSLLAAPAEADDDLTSSLFPHLAIPASSRQWNLELRAGGYRPDVDSEFSQRGQAAAPFAEVFGNGSHLLAEVELDRHLSHWAGTWALGLRAGYYRVEAASLSTDRQARTSDQTALRLVPLSVSLVYRVDQLLRRASIPLVPYAKVGLDCALWDISSTAHATSTSGRTLGWHAGAGLALVLDFLDPEAARDMDSETGVNHVALFVERNRAVLDGFHDGHSLHVGDSGWTGGLMFEF